MVTRELTRHGRAGAVRTGRLWHGSEVMGSAGEARIGEARIGRIWQCGAGKARHGLAGLGQVWCGRRGAIWTG